MNNKYATNPLTTLKLVTHICLKPRRLVNNYMPSNIINYFKLTRYIDK